MGGANFSTWPDLKWTRGNTHIAALESSFMEWQASAPVSVEGVMREDRQGIDLVARVPLGIPKHEWALTLGDALHNLRSAFDALAWGMAHFYERTPPRPKRIQFPICETPDAWADAVKAWVGEIEPELQERLRIVQPFTYAPPGMTTILSLIHDLDIQDKHKASLTVSANLHGINLGGSFRYDDPEREPTVRIEMVEGVKFEDGALLGTIHTGAPINMEGKMLLRPAMQVQLTHKDTVLDVMALLPQLRAETRRYLDILMHGLAEPEGGEGDWTPIEVTHPED